MSETPSTMLELGTDAPYFSLPDVVTGKSVTLKDFATRHAVLVMFICRHCPYVQHIKNELAALGKDYAGENVGIVAISANDALAYPDDNPDGLRAMSESLAFDFPFCYDESQAVAKAFTAACTPDFFLFDSGRKLVYRGQLDDSRLGNSIPVTGKDIRAAIDNVLIDHPVSHDQRPSVGCNIKWKKGNEPHYFNR